MRDAFLAVISLAFVVPSRCYGPQTQNSGADVNIINYSTETKDYGLISASGGSLPSESLLTPGSLDTTVSQPGARYWWQNVDSPFLANGQPSVISVSSTASPVSPVQLNIDSDAGTTGVRVASPGPGRTEVLYPNNPFLNGEIAKKTKVYSISPTVFNPTTAPTLDGRDYSAPSIDPLPSNSIAPSAYPSSTEYAGPTAASTPYPGCAAALKCVPENYCNAQGFASDTAVVLTKEFLYNRVPLTDCLDVPTGIVGKCCRDPDYKDPWPADLPHEHGHEHGHEHSHEHNHEHGHESSDSNSIQPDVGAKPTTGLHVIPISAYQPSTEISQPVGDYGGVPGGVFKPPSQPPPSPPYGQPQQPSIPSFQPQPTHPPSIFVPPYNPASIPGKPGYRPQPPQNYRPPPQQPFQPPFISGSQQPGQPGPSPYPPHPPTQQPPYGPGPSQPPPYPPSVPSQPPPYGPSQPQPSGPSPTFPSQPPTHPPTYGPGPSQPPPYPPSVPSQPPPYGPSQPQLPGPSPTFPSQPPTHPPTYGPGPSQPPPYPPSVPSQPPPYGPSQPQLPGPSPTFPSQPPTHPPTYGPGPSQPPPYPPSVPSQPPPYGPSQPPPYGPSQPQPSGPSSTFPPKPPTYGPGSSQPPSYPPSQPPPHIPSRPPYIPSKPPHSIVSPPYQSSHPPSSGYPGSSHETHETTVTIINPGSSYPSSPPTSYPQSPSNPSYPPQIGYPYQPPSQYPYPQQPPPQYPQQPPPSYPQQQYPQPGPYREKPLQPFTNDSPVVEVTQSPLKYHIVNKFGGTCGTKKNDATAHGNAPWHVIVYSSKNKDLICAGAIVSENAILTAAHCLDHSEADSTEVKIGPQGKMYKVAAIARHSQYEPISFNRDLALVFLHEPIPSDEYVEKICLPSFSPQQPLPSKNQECFVSSMTKDFEENTLQVMSVEVFPYKDCEIKLRNTYLGKYFILNDSFSCVSTPADEELCSVKTGSPIACSRGDGTYELFGIKSWDLGCQQYKSSAIFSNADVLWIQNTLSTSLPKLSENENARRKNKFKGESLEGVNINEKPGFGQGYGK